MEFEIYLTDRIYYLADVTKEDLPFLKNETQSDLEFNNKVVFLDVGGRYMQNKLINFEIRGFKFTLLDYYHHHIYEHISKPDIIPDEEKDMVGFLLHPFYYVIMTSEMWLELMDKLAKIGKEEEDKIASSQLDLEEFYQDAEKSGGWVRKNIIREPGGRM